MTKRCVCCGRTFEPRPQVPTICINTNQGEWPKTLGTWHAKTWRIGWMQQLRCYGDDRNKGFCVHCGGGPTETVDHVPSKVLLDEPYPENLMAAPACRECNNGLSLDEEYLACLLECVIAGDTAPEKLHRTKIPEILRRTLRSLLDCNVRGRRGYVARYGLPKTSA